MTSEIIKCNGISYRQGFIEVTGKIHPGHINVEVWNVATDVNIDGLSIRTDAIPENAVTGNVELELNVEQAKELVAKLQLAIASAE